MLSDFTSMNIIEESALGYERLIYGMEDSVGYRGIIAIHSTLLGPAVGGTRFWNYRTRAEAIRDALRLARSMTYKNALAGLPFGGGKAVIIGDPGSHHRERIFRAHGRLVNSLNGKYITAEDVGTGTKDMEYIRQETKYVAGLEGHAGDPSPKTARGVFRAMQAAARFCWGTDELSGKTVAIQGCGHVGYALAGELFRAGARLVVADVIPERVKRLVSEFGATAVDSDEIFRVKTDIFAPCALGGIINDQTLLRLRTQMVVGAANNQLQAPHYGDLLQERGILYAPDYAANAGGVIYGCCIEMLGWEPYRVLERIDRIYDTLLQIFSIAMRDRISTYQAADRLVEQHLNGAVLWTV